MAASPNDETTTETVPAALRLPPVFRTWWLGALRNAPIVGPSTLLVMLVALFAIAAPHTFFTTSNLKDILIQNSVMAILGTGLTLVILLGEIDLAFPGIVMVTGASLGLFFSGTAVGLPILGNVHIGAKNAPIAILGAVVIGLLLGLLNGVLVARMAVPSFIGSLGVLLLAEGWAYYWLQGQSAYDFPSWIISLGQGEVGPVPAIVLCAAIVALVVHVLLSRTIIGRYIYMTGASRSAARLSGVNSRRVILLTFLLAGVIASIGGLAYAGRFTSMNGTSGTELLLPTFAAVVLGGNSLFGGSGGIPNTILGVLLYGVLDNGLLLLNMNIFLRPFMEGVLLVIAVVLNVGLSRAAAATANRMTWSASSHSVDWPATPAAEAGAHAPERGEHG